jgi:hypothetical protein
VNIACRIGMELSSSYVVCICWSMKGIDRGITRNVTFKTHTKLGSCTNKPNRFPLFEWAWQSISWIHKYALWNGLLWPKVFNTKLVFRNFVPGKTVVVDTRRNEQNAHSQDAPLAKPWHSLVLSRVETLRVFSLGPKINQTNAPLWVTRFTTHFTNYLYSKINQENVLETIWQ